MTFKDGERKGQSVPYLRLYDLRHTFLTRLGEEGVTEIELMHIAGWFFYANGCDLCASIQAEVNSGY